MKQKLFYLLTVFYFHNTVNAQGGAWVQKANFGGTAVYYGVGFSIGSKGYIGTGSDGNNRKDFWEYDIATNAWTQKADFGGTARYAAVGFSIGSKGYIGTGNDGANYKDFWEYNPGANTWTQKADFGGTARRDVVGFSIGAKGYIGTGDDGVLKKDFWEYDPVTDTWTQKADFGGTVRSFAVGFSIGPKGYIGTGIDGAYKKDFWEYDPAANSWTQKTDFGGTARRAAVGFSIGVKGYIGIGDDGTYKKDFWEYTPSTNVWTQKADFGGTERLSAPGFSIGTKAYIGTGYDGVYKKDFWEYDPCEITFPINKTVYYGYPPQQCTTLTGSTTGLTAPYSYLWSTGETTASINVCPTVNTTYSLTITTANGCRTTDFVVNVIDVRCSNDKVYMCHIPGNNPAHEVTVCISLSAVAAHLAQGCSLGQCILSRMSTTNTMMEQSVSDELILKANPNPSHTYFMLQIGSEVTDQKISLRILDLQGRLAETRNNLTANQVLQIGNNYSPGVYIAEILQGNNRRLVKLVKL